MKTHTKLITPKLAEEILAKNTNNRPINNAKVAEYTKAMREGEWMQNGDTICLSTERLIDGQHRLHAIIRSGVPIECIIVDDLDPEVIRTKGIGKKWNGADILAFKGYKQCKATAAALQQVDLYLTGRVGKHVTYSNNQIVELAEKHPGIRDSVLLCGDTRRLISRAYLTAYHYLFSKKDASAANKFVDKLLTGVGLNEGDPIYLLRERLLTNSLAKAKVTDDYLAAILIKAWNFSRAGKTIKSLRFREVGENPEAFPVIA